MCPSPASQPNSSVVDGALPRLAQPSSYFVRRIGFAFAVAATTLALLDWLVAILAADDEFDLIDFLLSGLFLLYTPCLVIGFYNAALGFALRRRSVGLQAKPPSAADGAISARTVIAVVMRNEPPARVFAQLKVMAHSLDRAGYLHCFDFAALSDSDRPDVIAAEEAAFAAFRAAMPELRASYRRRTDHAGFKSGNVHDFCVHEGRKYDLLLLLDSDSLMTGEAVVRLARDMQANPAVGILQTLSVGLPSRSLFSRIFLFGHRHSMRCAMAGAAWWQGDCGHYWGHNCMIRVAPFVTHCSHFLPDSPLGGRRNVNWSSHDQIEAALMRAAGYEVRFLPEEGGSYEDNPPAFPDYLRRYRRWSLGSLQNLGLLTTPGFVPMSRFHLALLAERYGGAAGMLAFALLAAWAAASWPADKPFPVDSALALYMLWLLIYFSPKLFGVADALVRSRQSFGGAGRLVLGCLIETAFTVLLAPVSMFAAAAALVRLLFARPEKWDGQRRDSYRLTWSAAFAQFWPPTLFGLGLAAFLAVYAPQALPWFLPFVAGLILAVPFAVVTASNRGGDWAVAQRLCATPEEFAAPPVVAAVRPDLVQNEQLAANR